MHLSPWMFLQPTHSSPLCGPAPEPAQVPNPDKAASNPDKGASNLDKGAPKLDTAASPPPQSPLPRASPAAPLPGFSCPIRRWVANTWGIPRSPAGCPPPSWASLPHLLGPAQVLEDSAFLFSCPTSQFQQCEPPGERFLIWPLKTQANLAAPGFKFLFLILPLVLRWQRQLTVRQENRVCRQEATTLF